MKQEETAAAADIQAYLQCSLSKQCHVTRQPPHPYSSTTRIEIDGTVENCSVLKPIDAAMIKFHAVLMIVITLYNV